MILKTLVEAQCFLSDVLIKSLMDSPLPIKGSMKCSNSPIMVPCIYGIAKVGKQTFNYSVLIVKLLYSIFTS